MSDNDQISASIGLDLRDYQRGIRQGLRGADEMDVALDKLVDSANKAEKQLNSLSTDISVDIEANYSSLLDADRQLQSLDTTVSPVVDISVANETAARGVLDSLSSDISLTADVKVNVSDDELTGVKRKIEQSGGTVDAKVNADTSELGVIQQQLDTLKKLAVIDVVMNVAGLPEQIPLLGAAFDQDKARRTIAAGTGGDEALTAQYASQSEAVFADNFGANRIEAATSVLEVVRQTADETGILTHTGEDFGKVTEDTYTTAINLGEDFNAVLAAQDQLVRSGLVKTYGEAADLLNTAAQQGLNRNNDLLDSIAEYSPFFAKAGFSAGQMFSIFDRGLENASFNLDYVGDLVKEMDIRLQSAGSGAGMEFEAFKALDMLDLVEAYNAGEDVGAEILQGIIDKIASGEVPAQVVFDALGTKAEDITIPVLMKFDPVQVKEEFAQYNGTTIEVAAQLGGDAGSSWQSLMRTIESELATSISNAFDIPGKIQQLQEGVSKVSSLLDMGATLPEAIEVAFQIPGFADTVAHLESTMGNLGITFMEVAANILEAMGRGEAAGTVRGTIAQQAERQLAFDLKLADDGEGFSNAVATALNRGVSEANVQNSILTAMKEMMATGDTEGIAQLRDVLVEMSTITFSDDVNAWLSGQGIDPTNMVAAREAMQGLQDEFNRISEGGGAIWSSVSPENLARALNASDMAATAQTALAGVDEEFRKAEEAATQHLTNMHNAALAKLPGIEEIATSSLTPMNEQIMATSSAFGTTQTALTTMTTQAATDIATYGTTLSTATSNINDFSGNAQVQFGEVTPAAVDLAEIAMQEFGVTVLNTMLEAGENLQGFIDKLLSIGTLDIAVPSVGFTSGEAPTSGGQQMIPGKSVGGVIPEGTLARVHAGELAAMGGDVSILNRQTSNVLQGTLMDIFGAGMGGGNSSITNVTNNINIVNNGAAAAAATMNSAALRGF